MSKLCAGIWWALVNHSSDLPVLFETRRLAVEDRVEDEYLVQVIVTAMNPKQRASKPRSAARRASNRAYNQRRVAHGLCARCGAHNQRYPKWYCAPCAQHETARPRRRAAWDREGRRFATHPKAQP